jgi:hypothetical protein
MDFSCLTTLVKETTLLKEIEEPTESLVTEGIFGAMLLHRESRPPTREEVVRAMYALDGIDEGEDVDDRINRAILDGTVAVRVNDECDFLLFPADIREWWKVTMRYLINYLDDLKLTNARRAARHRPEWLPDKYHRQLISAVLPHLPRMVETNRLPTCYPWEKA